MIQLCTNSTPSRVIFEPLLGNGYIPSEKSRFICTEVTNEITIDIGSIAFHVVVKFPKKITADQGVAQKISEAWVQNKLPKQLSEKSYWIFFGSNELIITDQLATNIKSEVAAPSVKAEIFINESLLKRVTEEVSHLNLVREKFTEAKRRLWYLATNNYPLGFAQTLHEARELFRYIEQVLFASADLGGYEPHEARSAMRAYEDLATRKIVNNKNYEHSLRSLKIFANGVTLPNTWGKRPPV